MLTIRHRIKKILALKQGNKEIAIFYNPDANKPWRIEMGNPSNFVNLGESIGEVCSDGNTLTDALRTIEHKLIN